MSLAYPTRSLTPERNATRAAPNAFWKRTARSKSRSRSSLESLRAPKKPLCLPPSTVIKPLIAGLFSKTGTTLGLARRYISAEGYRDFNASSAGRHMTASPIQFGALTSIFLIAILPSVRRAHKYIRRQTLDTIL